MSAWLLVPRKAWAVLISRPVFAVAGLAVGLVLAGRCQQSHFGNQVIAGQSVALENTKAADKMEVVPSKTCPDLPTLAPNKKQAEKLAEQFNRPELAQDGPALAPGVAEGSVPATGLPPEIGPQNGAQREILALKRLPRLPWGGEVLASRIPGRAVDLDVSAAGAPVLEFPGAVYVEALYGRSPGTEPLFWQGRVRADLLRVKGTLTVGAEAGRMHFSGREEWYAAGGLSWKLR